MRNFVYFGGTFLDCIKHSDWDLDKMVEILQKAFSNAFLRLQILVSFQNVREFHSWDSIENKSPLVEAMIGVE